MRIVERARKYTGAYETNRGLSTGRNEPGQSITIVGALPPTAAPPEDFPRSNRAGYDQRGEEVASTGAA